MTSAAVFAAAALLFVLFGFGRSLAERFTTGIVIAGAVMWVESLVHIPWTRAALLIPMVLCAAAAVLGGRTPRLDARRSTWPVLAIALIAAYAAITARATNADLLLFWGPKGQAFYLARGVDVNFLRYPFHYLMHPDYPPLQPMVYAWCSTAAHRFSDFGALLLTPLYIFAAAHAFRNYAARAIGDGRAAAFATLLAALLAYTSIEAVIAGGADAQLILFEVVALSALTFADDATLVAAVALAGAAFTKVEGAVFAIVVVAVFAVLRRDVRRTAILAIPPLVLLGSWILFARHEHILDAFKFGGKPLYLAELPVVLSQSLRQASYQALYVPWIVAAAPLVMARRWRPALLPLTVAFATIAAAIFFYLHAPDASWWVASSARRVLLTPLVSLLVAASATSE
ncbi:MAG TPA: hypothetical protein VLU46_02985 [Thermoanaerobaculia bacterium]|nr:hypothetical protein [Thermoanaerobaculia bacterium]